MVCRCLQNLNSKLSLSACVWSLCVRHVTANVCIVFSLNILLLAGIQVAESLVVLAPSGKVVDHDTEILVDAGHIAAMHKIACLFPRLRMTAEIVYRYNIRFLYTTVYERLAMRRFRSMVSLEHRLGYSEPWKSQLTIWPFFPGPGSKGWSPVLPVPTTICIRQGIL